MKLPSILSVAELNMTHPQFFLKHEQSSGKEKEYLLLLG